MRKARMIRELNEACEAVHKRIEQIVSQETGRMAAKAQKFFESFVDKSNPEERVDSMGRTIWFGVSPDEITGHGRIYIGGTFTREEMEFIAFRLQHTEIWPLDEDC